MKMLLALIALFLTTTSSFAQNANPKVESDTTYWLYQYQYDHLLKKKYFTKGMSDDEMAGVLLYQSGANLKAAFICEIIATLTSTGAIAIYSKNPPSTQRH